MDCTCGQLGHLNMWRALKCFSRRIFSSKRVPHFWHLNMCATVVWVSSASLVAKVALHFLHLNMCSAFLCTSRDLPLLHLKLQSLHFCWCESMWRDISFLKKYIVFSNFKSFSDKPGNLLAADWAFLSFNSDNFHCRLEKDKLELLVLSKLICLKSPSQWLLWQPITPKYYFCKTFQKNMLHPTLISILLGSSTLFFFPCMLTAWFSKASLGGN